MDILPPKSLEYALLKKGRKKGIYLISEKKLLRSVKAASASVQSFVENWHKCRRLSW
jgi:hypothetical protein